MRYIVKLKNLLFNPAYSMYHIKFYNYYELLVHFKVRNCKKFLLDIYTVYIYILIIIY